MVCYESMLDGYTTKTLESESLQSEKNVKNETQSMRKCFQSKQAPTEVRVFLEMEYITKDKM